MAAVVLTHHHRDHVLGTSAFVTPEDGRLGKVPVFAHETLLPEFLAEVGGVTEELQTIRAAHMFGSYLSGAEAFDTDGVAAVECATQLVQLLPPDAWAIATSGTRDTA